MDTIALSLVVLLLALLYAVIAEFKKEYMKNRYFVIMTNIIKVAIVSIVVILILFLTLGQEVYNNSFTSSKVYKLNYFFEHGEEYQYAYFDDDGQLVEKSVPVKSYPPGLDKIKPTIVEITDTVTIKRTEWGPFYEESKKHEPTIMFFKYPSD